MKHAANFITCLNLFSGCIAIVFLIAGEIQTACFLVFLAALFDFLDGLTARLLKAWSSIGKELDSLADIVSFGLVPALIIFRLLHPGNLQLTGQPLLFAPFLLTIFSALRLAIFNVSEDQKSSFMGLPTPASGLLVASLPLIAGKHQKIASLIQEPAVMLPLVLILSVLLVAPIPLPSLKFNPEDKKGNRFRYIFLGICLLLILFLKFAAIPAMIALYLLSSLIFRKATR